MQFIVCISIVPQQNSFLKEMVDLEKKNQMRRIDILTVVSPFMWDFHPNSLPAHDFIYTSGFTVFKHGLAPFLLTLFYGTRFIFNCK